MQNSLKDKILKNKQQDTQEPQEQMKLDDARRVKVLSPGMLVFKRFIRNKLAVTGIIILAFMFFFSFIGPFFSPYKIAQTFFKDVLEDGKYASGKINMDSRMYNADGVNQDENMRVALLKVLGDTREGGADSDYVLTAGEEIEFSTIDGSKQYIMRVINPDPQKPSIEIFESEVVASVASVELAKMHRIGKNSELTFTDDTISDALKAAITEHAENKSKETELEVDGVKVTVVVKDKTDTRYYGMGDVAFTDSAILNDAVKAAVAEHIESGSEETAFMVGGVSVTVEKISGKDGNEIIYHALPVEPTAVTTFYIYSALHGKIAELQVDQKFLRHVNLAIQNGETVALDKDDTEYGVVAKSENVYSVTNKEGTPLFTVSRSYLSNSLTYSVQKEGSDETESKSVDFLSTIEDQKAFIEKVAGLIEEGNAKLREIRENGLANGQSEEEIFNAQVKELNDNEIKFSLPRKEKFTDDQSDEAEYVVLFGRDEENMQLTGEYTIIVDGQTGLSVLNNFEPVETKYDKLNSDYLFIDAAEKARMDNATTFEYDNETYTLEKYEGHDAYTVYNASGEKSVLISEIAVGPFQNGTELTVDFLLKFQDAVWQPSDNNTDMEFYFINQYGEETRARLHTMNANNEVWTAQHKTLIDSRAPLKWSGKQLHLLGTDIYGMDVLTRLMYGGRISLLVGFVVIFFEIIIGVIIGGISGYFGGVVDTILMRFVELFNAIPFYPMLIILGSVMDNIHVTATSRLMLTMAILGILGWTGIARTVRGQILSLREQDFMIATEATGIRTSRRIFKHLVPNVMPLLIVYATAGLGSIILTEATLGFLGLGVKYPMASWGSVINQALDMRVMSTNWWIWIPAGVLILLTVLGFNFVGDGLRDAFDPKMKR